MKNKTQSTAYFSIKAFDGLAALDAVNLQHKFAPHYHETFQLTWNRAGLFENHIDQKTLKSWPDSMALTHPKEIHETQCNQALGNSFFTLYLPPTLFAPQFRNDKRRLQHCLSDLKLLKLMQSIHQTVTQNLTPNDNHLKQLIHQLQSHHVKPGQIVAHSSELVEYAEFNFMQPFVLDEWAQLFRLNKYKLIRAFKQETGMTPNQYVIHKRILHSLLALQQGQSITDVALASGFFDGAHFYKYFKQIMGVTPRTYQQAY